MRKIITVTLNTAIDHVLEVPSFRSGKMYRSKSAQIFPAGKGINVTRTLIALGKKVVALGFVGRASLNLFNTLDSALCSVQLTVVDGETRRNISIVDPEQNTLTHIINPGYEVSNTDLENSRLLLKTILKLTTSSSFREVYLMESRHLSIKNLFTFAMIRMP
ncbi:MAG: 1-phosphofructokinase family hexose kinase [Candidatus Brocadiaceae bacterium]|nr:1-phosphofructokinase family hexose kinase [Candidatus Brocadiaceae bacterium]